MVAEPAPDAPNGSPNDARAHLRLVGDRVKPLALARERTMPLLPALTGLFPDGGLRRGSVVGIDGPGATSLALAVAAGPSAAGSWTTIVGDADVGLAAIDESGVVLERVFVAAPADNDAWATTMGALVGAVDVIIVGPGHRRASTTRRLSARLRERGSVIVAIGSAWSPAVDVGLAITDARWSGLGVGHGVLHAREVTVTAGGRGASARPRHAKLCLPGPREAVEIVDQPASADEGEHTTARDLGEIIELGA